VDRVTSLDVEIPTSSPRNGCGGAVAPRKVATREKFMQPASGCLMAKNTIEQKTFPRRSAQSYAGKAEQRIWPTGAPLWWSIEISLAQWKEDHSSPEPRSPPPLDARLFRSKWVRVPGQRSSVPEGWPRGSSRRPLVLVHPEELVRRYHPTGEHRCNANPRKYRLLRRRPHSSGSPALISGNDTTPTTSSPQSLDH